MSMRVNGRGKEKYACPSCENKAPKELKMALARKRHSNRMTRELAKFEVPKEARMKTKDLAKILPKIPDSPVIRDRVRNDPPKPRARAFCESVFGAGDRSKKVNSVLTKKLRTSNYKIISDNGFEVLAEAVV